AASAGQASVIVVEDDTNVREMVRESLVDMGLHVLTAGDGEAGLELVTSTRNLSLLVTDVGLPNLNGRQLADAARVA
ncbi:response regulator, partial [Paenibacillus polymyxa]|nr:response regulator [Paenibacillus polymyxa]